MSIQPSKAKARALSRMALAMELFRRLDPEVQAQTVVTYLAVAAQPGIAMRELQNIVGLPSSSMSRNISALSEQKRVGVAGLNLVRAFENPMDRRYKVVNLTPAGIKLSEDLFKALEG